MTEMFDSNTSMRGAWVVVVEGVVVVGVVVVIGVSTKQYRTVYLLLILEPTSERQLP